MIKLYFFLIIGGLEILKRLLYISDESFIVMDNQTLVRGFLK